MSSILAYLSLELVPDGKISLDIDVIGTRSLDSFHRRKLIANSPDPGLAPASKSFFSCHLHVGGAHLLYPAGTPEPGGWTTRELKRIIRGLAGLNFVSVSYFFVSIEILT